MVKAVKLERSASGTYLNSSQRIQATVQEGGGGTADPIPLTITRAPGVGVVLRFPTEVGGRYIIEVSNNLRDWQETETLSAVATLSTITPDISAPTPTTFYRVRRQ